MAESRRSGMPVGVKIIAVLYYIGAVLMVLSGILMIIGAGASSSMFSFGPFYSMMGSGLFIVGAIISLAFGVLAFFVGRGLWHGKSWARMTAIILAVLGLVSALFSFAIFNIIIDGLIAWYLLFSKEVKRVFR